MERFKILTEEDPAGTYELLGSTDEDIENEVEIENHSFKNYYTGWRYLCLDETEDLTTNN